MSITKSIYVFIACLTVSLSALAANTPVAKNAPAPKQEVSKSDTVKTDKATVVSKSDLDKAFKKLEENMKKRNKFIETRKSVIETLKRHNTASESELYGLIARAYEGFNNDSTIYYYRKAAELATTDEDKAIFDVRRASFLPLSGFIYEAKKIYDSINPAIFNLDDKIEYYRAGRRMYDFISQAYSMYPRTQKKWSLKAEAANDSVMLLASFDKNSATYKIARGRHLIQDGQLDRARIVINDVYINSTESDDYRALAMVMLADICEAKGDTISQLYYLVNSANDIMVTGSYQINPILSLGIELYQRGEVAKAYTYLSMALADSSKSREWMRMLQVAKSMPMIMQAQAQKTTSRNNAVTVAGIFGVLCIIGLIIVVVWQHRRLKECMTVQERLVNSANTKESYMSQFLTLCAIYMEKLNEFVSVVNRKITAGKVADITRMINSNKFLDMQNAEFYDVFDSAVLSIFPDFVPAVNMLMKPEYQIELKEDEKLNTDLRLLALMRLGIEDSTKMARILGYSLNTVYTYRNKLKARAVNRETFDDDIMKINSI
jgi:tetratricopeptide (TPR) repeat protein